MWVKEHLACSGFPDHPQLITKFEIISKSKFLYISTAGGISHINYCG